MIISYLIVFNMSRAWILQFVGPYIQTGDLIKDNFNNLLKFTKYYNMYFFPDQHGRIPVHLMSSEGKRLQFHH